MLKRIISLCIVLALGLSVCFALPVSAANVSEQQLVCDLGIMPEPDGYGLVSKGFTRVSFAHVLAQMNQAEYAGEVTRETMNAFASDIIALVSYGRNSEYQEYAYILDYETPSKIMYALSMGYMQTDEKGKFNPNSAITKNEALIAFVKLLGYDSIVEANGGGEAAYLAQAQKLGLLKGVKVADNSKLSYEEVTKMVANAMGAPFVAYESVSGTPSCLWELWGLSVGTGIIEANSNIGIGESKVGANRVKINGTTLYSRIEVPNALVGAKVTYYTVSGERGEEIVSLYVGNTEENITLRADEIESVSDKGTYLEIIDVEEEKILVDKRGYLMLNGKVQTPTKTIFNLFISGDATFLDTDEDGYYDVIHMTLLHQVVVDGINAETMTLRTRFEKKIFDFSGIDVLEVYNSNKAVEFSNIKEGMAVGIACDAFTISGGTITWNFANAEYIRLYISNMTETGMIDGIDSVNTFSINGVKKNYGSGYKRLKNVGLLPELKLGYYVNAFYDNEGKLTYYEMATGVQAMSYGYLIAGGIEGGSMDRTTKLKILDANNTFHEYATSPKFILDGASVETGSINYSVNGVSDVDLGRRQLIRYRVLDGLVREVDTAVVRGTAENTATTLNADLPFDVTVSNNSQQTVRYGAIDRRYAFTPDAVIFVDEAPIGAVNPSEELFTVQKASSLADGSYYIAGFDANEYNELSCAVRYSDYGVSTAGTRDSLYIEDYCHVVGTIWRAVDSAGEECFKISVAGAGEQKELLVPLSTLKLYSLDFTDEESWLACMTGGYFTVHRQNPENFESIIHSGDIIRFTTNTKGEITYIEKLFDFATWKDTIAEVPNKSGSILGFAELEKISGNNYIYSYGTEGDGTTYVSRHVTKLQTHPLYHVKTGKIEMVPFSKVPSAATGNLAKVFIRYYNYGQTRDNIFYVYD